MGLGRVLQNATLNEVLTEQRYAEATIRSYGRRLRNEASLH